MDLYHVTQERIADEVNDKLQSNTLLYPIARAYLDKYPQHHDINCTYEQSMESIGAMIKNVTVIDTFITVNEHTSVRFKLWCDNTRIFKPNSIQAREYSNWGWVPTPNIAISERGQYTAVMVSDIMYSYEVRHNKDHTGLYSLHQALEASGEDIVTGSIPDGYRVNVPIPVGSKYCALTDYDDITLIRTADEMKSLYGMFIIDGLFKYIIPIYKKPFNKPIIVKNMYDEQMSRTEVIYTKTYDYENSYFVVGAMVRQSNVGRGSAAPSPPDFGFSLQLNHPKMYSESMMDTRKKLINFVPIKLMFAAFGCTTDREMMMYICPDGKDIGLINTIRLSCLQGYKHMAAVKRAGVPLVSDPTYMLFEQPLTEYMAKYIIGMNILHDDTLSELRRVDASAFMTLVAQTVTAVFNERFMPGITGSTIDRNTAICVELGYIVRSLYLIGFGLEASQDKTSLTNRRMRHGQQLTYEYKSFHNARMREIIDHITPIFKDRRDFKNIQELIHNKLLDMSKVMSISQSKSLINALKGTSKEQSKIKAEYLQPKNNMFVQNFKRQIVISSEQSQKGATVTWEHRTVHPSELFFVCPTQTPEAGSQTGRFKTPAIYTYLTLASTGHAEMALLETFPSFIKSLRALIASNKVMTAYSVKLNGSIVGYVPQYEPLETLYKQLMDARRRGEIHYDTSIIVNHQLATLNIWTDSGRIVSPFVVVNNVCTLTLKPAKTSTHTDDDIKISGTVTFKPEFMAWIDDITKRLYASTSASTPASTPASTSSAARRTSTASTRTSTPTSTSASTRATTPASTPASTSSAARRTSTSKVHQRSASARVSTPNVVSRANPSPPTDSVGHPTPVHTGTVPVSSAGDVRTNTVSEHVLDEGIHMGYIEYLDPEMAINNAVVAPCMQDFYATPHMYTHIALPNHIHGIVAALVPGINLSVGVRASLSTNHVKQAIGPSIRYPQMKYITENNILTSPQMPLVRACTYDHLSMGEMPYGQNVIVAFFQAKYNQEDAIILNSASVQSGLLQIDSLMSISDIIQSKDEEFVVPGERITLSGNVSAYSKLHPTTALPRRVGDVFYTYDPLIGKVRKTPEGMMDISVLNDKPDGRYPITANPRPIRSMVKNYIHEQHTSFKMAVYGQFRTPIVGDKFNSEYAQKGTVGKLMDVSKIPYTTTGLRPDIIFSPPGIMKRKTYGQVYIGALSKIASLLGCPIDCTQYHTIRTDEDLFRMFKALGLRDNGYETMYDPETGRPYTSRIFVSSHYWERQSHLVEEKLNVRNGGPRVLETGQPTKGRKHGGGQAFDRMSFDSHTAAGIGEIIRDSHLNQGSKIPIGICNKCHTTTGYLHAYTHEWTCPRCGKHDDFIIREVPPASVLLTHILNGAHVSMDYISNSQ